MSTIYRYHATAADQQPDGSGFATMQAAIHHAHRYGLAQVHELHYEYADSELVWESSNDDADDTDSRLFEALALALFESGFSSNEVVANRWNDITRFFYDWNIDQIALMPSTPSQRFLTDKGIIRNRMKRWAVILNAQTFLQLRRTHGSVANWFDTLDELPEDERIDTLIAIFPRVGPNTAAAWLVNIDV